MALMALLKFLLCSEVINMARYALIDTRSNMVANVIVWDGVSAYVPPPYRVTRLVRPNEFVGPGFSYDPMTDTFIAPPPEPEPEPEPEPTTP